MDGGKKLVVVVVLLAVIVAAVVFIVKRYTGEPAAPIEITGRGFPRIDIETYELVERTGDEWNTLGRKDNLFKNPNTGKYSMARPIKCSSCGEAVPHPGYLFPMPPARKPPGMTNGEMDIIIADVDTKAAEILSTYACPKCGAVDIIAEGTAPRGITPGGPRSEGGPRGR